LISALVIENPITFKNFSTQEFYDYIKVGLPLALILGVMAVIFIPIIWPFQ